MFRGLLVDKTEAGYFCSLVDFEDDALPDGDVTVRIEYSTLNYKDALAVTGEGPIIRKFPLVPGIDFAGVVEASADPRFASGDKVLLTGYDVGVSHSGGYAERTRVPGDWLISLPAGMEPAEAMPFGTAGFTAMLSILKIERHGITPDSGPILVTGAGGGVGGLAIHLLSRLGYRVVAATGRPAQSDYLTRLGASEVIDRSQLTGPGKPLARALWAAAIDNAGSHTLANVCAGLMDDGLVAACGNAQGLDLPGSVAPFILRGITLSGINSVNRSHSERLLAWRRLHEIADPAVVASMVEHISLAEVPDWSAKVLKGEVLGRLIVDVGR